MCGFVVFEGLFGVRVGVVGGIVYELGVVPLGWF